MDPTLLQISNQILSKITPGWLFITPTPPPSGGEAAVGPPAGWAIAGLLLLLLVYMVFQTARAFFKRKFRKKKTR